MATLQELKTKIENANTLGRTNLSAKGIEVSEDATTYEIMQAIANIVATDTKIVEHTTMATMMMPTLSASAVLTVKESE